MAENGNGGPDAGAQKQINDLLNTAQGLMGELGIKGKDFKKVLDQISGGQIKNLGILKEELAILAQMADMLKNQSDGHKKINKLAGDEFQLEKVISKFAAKHSGLIEDMLGFSKDKVKLFMKEKQHVKSQINASRLNNNISAEYRDILSDQVDDIGKSADFANKFGGAIDAAMDLGK